MNTIANSLGCGLLLALLPACFEAKAAAVERPVAPVEKAVQARTGRTIRWEQDLAAREENRVLAEALWKRPLTLAGTVQLALLGNRALQATFEEIGLGYAEVREARMLANPSADLDIKFPDRAPTAPLFEWSVAQNFLQLVMLPVRTKVARERLAATQGRVTQEVVSLVAEVKAAYFTLLADEQLATRQTALLEAQRASLELMQRLHAAGNMTDLRLLQEQAQYAQRRLEAQQMESDRRAHREKLNRLLGAWGEGTEWKLAAHELPPVPVALPSARGLETLAVSQRSDLAAARSELESAARAVGLERAFRFIGALDFGVAGENDSDGTKLTGPSLRLELPLFQQGQARVARGEAEVRRAAARFEQLAIELRSAVREGRDRLLGQRDRARFYREEVVPLRQQITALTLTQYNAMLLGAFEAFAARREDMEAERTLIEITRDYWITRADLERTVGGDLNRAPSPTAPKLIFSAPKPKIHQPAHRPASRPRP